MISLKLVILEIFVFGFVLQQSFTVSYSFFDPPQIKVEKWIESALWESDDKYLDWNTDFTDIPEDALKIADRGSTLIVSHHVAALGLVCNASYPVEWSFEHGEHSEEEAYNIIMRNARESKNVLDPTHDRFIAILELYGEDRAVTGKYVCQKVGGQKGMGLEKNIFIYWDVNSPPYLVLSGRTIHIHSEDNQTVVLPCHVTNPEAQVTLSHEINETFQILSPSSWGQYDPQIGFKLNMPLISQLGGHGRFKCNTDTDDEVNIIVEKGPPPKKDFDEVLSPGTGIYYDPERMEIACCSRKGKPPPSLHSIYCLTPSICKMKEHKLLKAGNNGKRIKNGSCISEKVYMKDYGLLRCKGDGIDIFRTFYSDFGPLYDEPLSLYFNFETIPPEKMMHITVHEKGPYYDMQIVTVTCEGMSSYFSDGHKWGVRWRNNSVTSFEPFEYVDDPKAHGMRLVDFQLNWKMMELVCYLPVWNSTQWISRSVKVDVQRSSYPNVIGPPVETLYWEVGEAEKLLECQTSGKPAASVKWTKNGDPLAKSMVILEESGTSVIMIRKVTEDTQGDYKCVATNILGTSSKVFKVFVSGTASSSAWSTTAAVLVPLLIIAFVGTLGVLVWKMQLQKKIVNHLSRVVFRDAERQNEYSA